MRDVLYKIMREESLKRWHLSCDLKYIKAAATQRSEAGVFQTEGTARSKFVRQGYT